MIFRQSVANRAAETGGAYYLQRQADGLTFTLFVLAVLFGGFSHTWLLIVIVGLLFGGGFRRI